jgi:hypothetical protein
MGELGRISWCHISLYEETKQLVQSVLKQKSMEDHRTFVKSDSQGAEGLRIPAKPEIVNNDSGWQGPEVFFFSFGEKS